MWGFWLNVLTLCDEIDLGERVKPKPHPTRILTSGSSAAFITAITICISGSALGAEIPWNGSVSNDWNTAANWTPGLPTAPDDAVVNNAGAFPTAVISANLTVNPRDVIVGNGGATGQLDMTAGVVAPNGWTFIGRGAGSTGTFNVNAPGGSYSSGRIIVGDGGTGTMKVDAGTVNSLGAELWVGQGAGSLGTLTINAGGAVTSDNWTVIGRDNGNGTLNMNGGTFTKTGGGAFIVGDNAVGTVIQSGGTIDTGGSEFWVGQGGNSSSHTISGGDLKVGNWLAVGRNGGNGTLTQTGGNITKTGGGDLVIGAGGTSAGTVNTSGGILSVNNQIQISENGSTATSSLNISSTAQVSASTVLVGSGGATGTGILSMTGGSLTTGQISGSTGISNATFNGGQVIATGNQAAFITSLGTATLGAGNLSVNSNGFAIASNQVFNGVGGLNKLGTGTLTLSASSGYTGKTTVQVGTLALAATGAISASTTIEVQAGAVLDVSAVSGWTLATGQTLQGTGAVVATAGANLNGTVAPGTSPGTLTIVGPVSMGGTYNFEYVSGTTGADLLDVNGTLALAGAVLNPSELGTYNVGDKFTIAAYEGLLTGTFTGYATDDTTYTINGNLWSLDYNDLSAGLNGPGDTPTGSTSFITMTAVPEPSAALLGSLGVLALLRRRRVS